MFNQMSRSRITLSILFLLAVSGIIFLFWTMYQSYTTAGAERKNVSRALTSLRQLEDFVDCVQTLDASKTNYLLTRDNQQIQTYQTKKIQTLDALEQLLISVRDSKEGFAAVKQIQEATITLLAQDDGLIRSTANQGILNTVQLRASQRSFDTVIARTKRFEALDRKYLQESNLAREKGFTAMGNNFLAIFTVLLIVSVFAFWLIVHEIRHQYKQKAAQQKADSIINNITDPILVTNSAFQVVEWNAYAEVLYQLDRRQPVDYPIYFADLFVNRTAAEEVMQALLDHSGWSGECLHKRLDGTNLFMQASCTALINSHQQFNGLVIQVRDLTQQRESDLRANYLANLIATSKDAIFSTNLIQEIVSWNESAEKLYGVNEPDALGHRFVELVQNIKENNGTQSDDESYNAEITVCTKNNQCIHVLADTIPVKDSFGVTTGYAHYHRDITIRKELEQKLREFNEELSDLVREKSKAFVDVVDRIADGFLAFDSDWRYTYINPKAGEILNIPIEDAIGQVIWEKYPEAKTSSFHQHYLHAQEKQVPVFVTEYFTPIQRWLEYAIYPSLTGTTVFVRDITSRHEAEANLRAQERRYRDLIENLTAGVIVHSVTGEILIYNETAAQILGLDQSELNQMRESDALQGWQLLCENGQLLQNNEFPVSKVLRSKSAIRNWVLGAFNRKDQRVHWALVNAYPELNEQGDIQEVVVTFVDITDQKEIQLKLEQSQEQLKRVLLAMNEGWWDWDIVSDTVYYSPRWYAILGYEPNAFPKDSSIWNELLHPDDQAKTKQAAEDAVQGGKDLYEVESRLKHKDGHYVQILSRGFVQRNSAGDPIRISGVNIDLTDLNQAEQQLKQALASKTKYDN